MADLLFVNLHLYLKTCFPGNLRSLDGGEQRNFSAEKFRVLGKQVWELLYPNYDFPRNHNLPGQSPVIHRHFNPS